jgi:hypothetical protein
MVMMTRIEDEDAVFVHGSDIQFLDGEAVQSILAWHPDILFVAGPPLYHPWISSRQREMAWDNARLLARQMGTLIIDHPLLRCEEGLSWLDDLSPQPSHRVISGADFMNRPRRLLEARREELYENMTVPEGWHDAYARGDADTRPQSWVPMRRPLGRVDEQTDEKKEENGVHLNNAPRSSSPSVVHGVLVTACPRQLPLGEKPRRCSPPCSSRKNRP